MHISGNTTRRAPSASSRVASASTAAPFAAGSTSFNGNVAAATRTKPWA